MFMGIRHTLTALAATAMLTVAAGSAQATNITGAGSTFVGCPLRSRGGGRDHFAVNTGRRFAEELARSIRQSFCNSGTEATMDLAELGLGQFPVVIGGIVPVVNFEGMQPGDLKLTGPSCRHFWQSAKVE
jgi:phosphate transport system substrate-binding protein